MADVDVPKVGKVNKKILIPIGVAAGGFVIYRYYVARQDVGTGEEEVSEYDESGLIPGVTGSVSPTNSYGSPDNASPAPEDYGFRGTSNSEWSQYVTTHLAQSDRWSYTDIVTALGNFLDRKPLSTLHQDIVRAGIALAGYPPVGAYTLIPGGNTDITVAPSGVKATSTATSIAVSFNPVAGAASYSAYRGTGYPVATNTRSPVTISGLRPNTTYSVHVAAVSASGKTGPHSGSISIKTKSVTLAVPSAPKVSQITTKTAHVTTNRVPNADGYNWLINGAVRGHTDAPVWTATGLKSITTYKVSVAADISNGPASHSSTPTSFRTK